MHCRPNCSHTGKNAKQTLISKSSSTMPPGSLPIIQGLKGQAAQNNFSAHEILGGK
jgi:hypothetical protein